MATPIIMPRQGQSVETCIITLWHKNKGENVSEGDILFSYETDKAAFDEEAKVSGVLLDIFYNEGDEVPVLENVAVIGMKGESTDSFRPGGVKPSPVSQQKETIPSKEPEKTAIISESGRPKISPLARRLSAELDVDISGISGTGPQGRIIREDIERASLLKHSGSNPKTAATNIKAPVSNTKSISDTNWETTLEHSVEKISNMRRIIAARMHESLQNSAQLTHHLSADARGLLSCRKKIKQLLSEGKPTADISINDLVCYAVIRALRKHPHMNAHFLGDSIRTFKKVHLAIAVDTPRGLMVPAIQNADDLNLSGLAHRLKKIVAECKDGSIAPDLLASTAASFTISNLGAYGIELFTPVLNVPQTGILGVNTITYRPADVGDGTIGFVPHIGFSLTYDHRAVDGAPASAFLKEIKIEIENLTTDIL